MNECTPTARRRTSAMPWPPRNRVLAIVGLGWLLLAAPTLHGQDGLEALPGHERYLEVQKALRTIRAAARITDIQWAEDPAELRFRHGEADYRVDLGTLELEELEAPADDEEAEGDDRPGRGRARPRRGRQRDREESPDGNWLAISRDWNIILQRTDELGGEIAITTDGTRKHRFGQASWVYGEELRQTEAMWWSPDSRTLVYYEFDERDVPDFHLLKGWSGLRNEVLTEGYPKPGEPNPRAALRIYDVASGKTIRADVNVEEDHYIYDVRFTPDGSELLVNRTNRHQDRLELLAVDPETGAARVVLVEEQPCWQKNRPLLRFLADGERFIWETERTGYQHYELRHLDGRTLATLTRGSFPDRAIEHVDEAAGVVFYTSFSGDHPLNARIHRVRLDGTDATCLTEDALNHELVSVSPDGRWFISRAQTLAEPPVTALYDDTGRRALILAETETSKINALEVPAPELFTFKADDGATDLYGWLYKPSDYDASRSYPLLIDVYGGPLSQGVRNTYRPAYAACEFGFIVAKIDNRGTTGRGKAFECATYQRLGDVDLKDQVEGVRFLARRPEIDGSRVGIMGHSYGGYMAALAIVKHPDVFHAAVAGAPVTDWRQYDTIYTERFMRTPEENPEGYDAGSCLTYAEQLRGRLLILHGLVDDNVHPNNTWQLVAALHKAGRPFDMHIFPDNGHGLGAEAMKRRWLFLHEHLVGGEQHPTAAGSPATAAPAGATN